LKNKINEAKIRVIPLAIHTGRFSVAMPYINHIKVPRVKRIYIYNEIAEVSFVRIVLIAWGKKEEVVRHAANKPIAVIQVIWGCWGFFTYVESE
jgi:hypothetical protein